ncbi:MAG: hypothetical protein E6772_00705 [Dysgonomonas sp.]|nr:hypothetical protein [Dysgonomonas sp.]
MTLQDLSVCFHTKKVQECKDFYVKYFDAVVTFECDWYITVLFNKERMITLQFMLPQFGEPLYGDGGATLNFYYEDVDAMYKKLVTDSGLKVVSPLEDQEWGCRAFTINDPIGNILYIYTPTEMKGEYKDAVKVEL